MIERIGVERDDVGVRGLLTGLVFGCVVLGSFGCGTQSHEERVCGEDGSVVSVSGQTVCVYRQDIVIETGFACPEALPHRQDFDHGSVCSQMVDGLGDDELAEVVEWSVEQGWDEEPGNSLPAPVGNSSNGAPGDPPPNSSTPSNNPTPDNNSDPIPPNTLINNVSSNNNVIFDTPEQVDVLWVIDNSSSMCLKQEVLRDNFELFADGLIAGGKDFHIAVTTTHAPESEFSIEPVAEEALIQAVPQPVPGNHELCLTGSGVVGGVSTEYAPLRRSLELAKSCLADPALAAMFTWTDEQIDCALQGGAQQNATGCVVSTGLVDRDGSGAIDTFDLFPLTSDYRVIPKVLMATDYTDNQGQVDKARLVQDFKCISAVGTRGDGYEKGLRAAVRAVAPDLTGGALGLANAVTSRPNYGLIRRGADFALIFVTDENDCSHDGRLTELGNMCGGNVCEYYNSTAVSDADSLLVSPEAFAVQFRENLAATKGVSESSLPESKLFIGSIIGEFERPTMPFPTCGPGMNPEVPSVCTTAQGESYSGDRYERFARQFQRYFPSDVTDEVSRLDFSVAETSWMCAGDFGPALEQMGQELAKQ